MYKYLVCYYFLFILFLKPAIVLSDSRLFEPTIVESKSYTEIFTLTAILENNSFVQIQMTITNLGRTNKNATAKMLVLNESRKPFKANMWYNNKKWCYSDKPWPCLTIGSCKIRQQNQKIEFTGLLDNATIHIIINTLPQPIRAPHSDYQKKSDKKSSILFYEYKILIPWSQLNAYVIIPGMQSGKFNGYGMVEQARSVGHPKDISQGWVTFRGNSGNDYFLANFRIPPEKNIPIAGWIWKNNDNSPEPIKNLQIQKNINIVNKNKIEIYTITAPDSLFCIISSKCLYRYSFIDELGPFLGYIVKVIVGDPVTCYYNAQVEIPGYKYQKLSIPGVLELMNIK